VNPIVITGIELSKSTATLNKGNTLELTYTILPSNAENKSTTWSSSNTNVATVNSSGTVTAIATGSATITVTSNANPSVKATCTVTVVNNTYEKKAIFFGDSITYGTGNMVTVNGKTIGYSWANYIGDHYDLAGITNAGKSGWYVSNNSDKFITSIVRTYKGTNYDYIMLHGGCNDAGNKIKMGTYNDSDFSGNYDDTTFLGGLETYLYTVINQWPNATIGYIINYQTPNNARRVYSISEPYYVAMRNVLKKWHIKYIDLFDGTASNGQTYSQLLKVTESTYMPDNLHLNGEGYRIISPYIYEFMNGLGKCNKTSVGRCS
jgi:lysophospholipase L1-like esterase